MNQRTLLIFLFVVVRSESRGGGVRFNPSRLVIARKRRGFSRVALARESGLGVRSIVYYESGEVVPSDEAVSSLVGTLRFPQAFFFGPDMEELNPRGVSFRALSSMTAAQRDSALAAGAVALEFSKFIEARFELPKPALPDLREFEPETAAQVLRTEWKIGERPIKNVVHLLEAHGARVFSLPVDSASVDAFSAWHDGLPLVLLNTMKSAERGANGCCPRVSPSNVAYAWWPPQPPSRSGSG